MTTTREMIGEWFDEGIKNNQKYMIVVCDTFDYEDYPVYVNSEEDFLKKQKECSLTGIRKIMEVYDLSLGKTAQLNEHRAFNGPKYE